LRNGMKKQSVVNVTLVAVGLMWDSGNRVNFTR